MDRLDCMKSFVKVVECGSFSAAARQMGTPLATVSRKVADLEAHLRVELLRRTTRRLELTETGALYLKNCRAILDRLEEAERLAGGEYRAPKGTLQITASTMFGRIHVVPVVAEFLKAYPDIDVRLSLSDRTVNLVEGHLDFAFRIGELADSSMVATRIGATRYLTCASAEYVAAHGEPADLTALSGHPCITFEGLSTPSATVWQYELEQRSIPVAVHSRLAVSTVDAAIEACLLGVGICRLLEYPVLHHLQSGLLKPLMQDYEPPPRPIHLLYGASAVLPLKMRAFIDFTVPRLKNVLSGGRT